MLFLTVVPFSLGQIKQPRKGALVFAHAFSEGSGVQCVGFALGWGSTTAFDQQKMLAEQLAMSFQIKQSELNYTNFGHVHMSFGNPAS